MVIEIDSVELAIPELQNILHISQFCRFGRTVKFWAAGPYGQKPLKELHVELQSNSDNNCQQLKPQSHIELRMR